MPPATINHATLVKLTEAGVVRNVQVIGQPAGWTVLVQYGMTERILAAQRSHQIRIFRKLDTLVLYLQGAGIPRFAVDAAQYTTHSDRRPKRPDRAAAMKAAHATAHAHLKGLV